MLCKQTCTSITAMTYTQAEVQSLSDDDLQEAWDAAKLARYNGFDRPDYLVLCEQFEMLNVERDYRSSMAWMASIRQFNQKHGS